MHSTRTVRFLAVITAVFVINLWYTKQNTDKAALSGQLKPQPVKLIEQSIKPNIIGRRLNGSVKLSQQTTIATTTRAYEGSELSRSERESIFFRVNMEPILAKATKGGPMDYLPNYRSPCWHSVPSGSNTCGLSCLPLVFLAGVVKSGTSDLFSRLIQHPLFTSNLRHKEPWWWNHKSLKNFPRNQSFEGYVSWFNYAACEIESFYDNETDYHPGITIDATPGSLWDYDGWEFIPGNKGLNEPKYILPSVLRVLIPQALYIVILRRPSERVYSHFRMRFEDGAVQYFHDCSVAAIDTFNRCLEEHSLRSCTYNNTLVPNEDIHGLTYRASMYYVYLKDWLDILPRKQMLILKAEEYYANRTRVLIEAFSFLKLETSPPKVFYRLEKSRVVMQKRPRKKTIMDPMFPKTRRLLDDFYSPYNDKLARLLNDNRFKWTEDEI